MSSHYVADEALIQQYYNCESSAFDELYDRHFNRLMGLISRLVAHSEDIEGLVQDIFIKAMRTKDRIGARFHMDKQTKFSTWLNKIALNHALDYKRRPNREVKFSDLVKESDEGEEFGPENWLPAGVARPELERIMNLDLERCMALLNKEDRICIDCWLEDMKLKEIAEIFGCSTTKAHNLRKRAIANLVKCLSKRAS